MSGPTAHILIGCYRETRNLKRNSPISLGKIIGFLEWGSGVSFRRSLKVNLLLPFAVADIWGFLLLNPYWLLHAPGRTPNISHATTTGLESAGKKQLNSTVLELIENLPGNSLTWRNTGIFPNFEFQVSVKPGARI